MRRIKFTGIRRIGTLNPRHLWIPGEIMEVNDEAAEMLLRIPGFKAVRRKRKRKS